MAAATILAMVITDTVGAQISRNRPWERFVPNYVGKSLYYPATKKEQFHDQNQTSGPERVNRCDHRRDQRLHSRLHAS
jgi:hypothetical protein